MNAKSHLRGDGVGLFHTIRLTYKTTANMSFSKKFSRLTGGSHVRARNEDIDTYVARALTLTKELNANGWPVSPTLAKHSFIMGLGPDFTDIIEKYNKDDLQSDWLPYDLNNLILPAKAHLELKQEPRQHNKNYKSYFDQRDKSNTPSDTSKSQNTSNTPRQLNPKDQDRQNHIHQAIAKHSFRAEDFSKEVRPNCCVSHNTAHVTSMCHVIKNLLHQANKPDVLSSIAHQSTSSVSKLTSPTILRQSTFNIHSPLH